MAKKTSEDLVDEMTGMAAEIRRLAVAETRRDLAAGIEEHFLGTKSSRKGYTGTPDECVIEALDDFPTMRDPRLLAIRERLATDGVTDDFRAGIVFALRLVADDEYDY
ncbi:hypothetical protein ACFQ1S_20965 [Kibdelosporangium lantanae]|jgi:hypothetical protein|uniref:Uncharacterized protein n=1 Tax=Kibdelosporangium lantanae TaxID=1497396 RepID=A0ABW3MB22_9PSEU